VRVAVIEIRELNGREGSEDAMREAKVRLAMSIKVATAAGVSQEELIEASNPPAVASAEDEALKVGDQVEVFGLESESGKMLNGKVGTIVSFVEEKGRFQIELGGGAADISVRPANLRRYPPPAQPPAKEEEEETEDRPAEAAAGEEAQAHAAEDGPLIVGDRVEIFGLESEAGSKLNGREGSITEHLEDKGRIKVQLSHEEIVSIKPANLRRISPSQKPPAADGGESKPEKSAEGGRESDSSSSSSSSKGNERPQKRRNHNFGGAKKSRTELTPEEKLEMLLTGKVSSSVGSSSKKHRSGGDSDMGYCAPPTVDQADIERDVARAAGAAAAAAATAAASMSKEPLRPGDRVEVHGLQSAAGRPLNRKQGTITKFDQAKGRFMVDLGLGSMQSLKPENLRHMVTNATPFQTDYSGATAGYTLL